MSDPQEKSVPRNFFGLKHPKRSLERRSEFVSSLVLKSVSPSMFDVH